VIVLDLLGFGRSDPPRDHPVGIRAHADRVVGLLDLLGVHSACVVGHDIGGAVALALAVRHPHRISRLGLVGSAAFDAWPSRAVKLAGPMLPLARHLPPAWILSVLRAELQRGYRDADRAQRSIARYVRPFADAAGRDALFRHLRALDPAETDELTPRLKDLVQPTAIVWGRHDPFLPVRIGQRLHDAIPGSTLEILEDGCHFLPEEAPQQVAAAIAGLLAR
jgi:pimeloyl-ACP methyl ester carboxylesterase